MIENIMLTLVAIYCIARLNKRYVESKMEATVYLDKECTLPFNKGKLDLPGSIWIKNTGEFSLNHGRCIIDKVTIPIRDIPTNSEPVEIKLTQDFIPSSDTQDIDVQFIFN